MVSELRRMPMVGVTDGSFGDDFEKEIGHLLREERQQEADDQEKELNLYRSGSAPPTVEGSSSAVGDFFSQRGVGTFSEFPGNKMANGFTSEEEFRSDPEYVSYYFSHSHLNPRLPPPLLSREDWRFAQRLQGGSSVLGGIGDKRKVNRPEISGDGRSRASMPPGFDLPKDIETHEDKGLSEWDSNGLIGLSGLGLGSKQKSFAEIFQSDLVCSTPISKGHPSRPTSRNAYDESNENLGFPDAELSHLHHELPLHSPNGPGSSVIAPSIAQSGSFSYAAVLGASLSRSTTPDPQLVGRTPSPCLTPIGEGRGVISSEKRGLNTQNTFNGSVSAKSPDLRAAFSGMNITNGAIDGGNLGVQQDVDIHDNYFLNLQDAQNHNNIHLNNSEPGNIRISSFSQSSKVGFSDFEKNSDSNTTLVADRHLGIQGSIIPSPRRPSLSVSNSRGGGGFPHPPYLHQSVDPSFQNYGINGYNNLDPALASIITSSTGNGNLQPLFENLGMGAAAGMDSRISTVRKLNTTVASEPWTPNRIGTQFHGPFLDPMYVQYMRALALHDPLIERNCNSYTDIPGIQKAYLGSLLSPQSLPYKSTGSNHHNFYENPYGGVGMPYPASPIIPTSLVGHGNGSLVRQTEYSNIHLPSGMRNMVGGIVGPWLMDGSNGFGSSLLDEFKSNKTKCFELSEIASHVVEFSADQYGSRFIQQKLETATVDEKDMVFQEIMPQALSLMTDVFGNYVVQKFFEHGSRAQIRELANKLNGHVLTLSLQMYGCRVIQKAIEVVDVDQKVNMVEELDGHVMRCVRDQNGNHVIQKCIECVPEEAIQFIVTTFFDHVVTLSTHPYGCRVVQRILEHCKDPETQSKVMDEILGSVSMLAKDQYGNYVVQHVLEHGKLHERSTIIEELAGNIVQMSQQKFASNVVEKCLTFGGPSEREILVNEMLGSTDENEPLQAMMKDQFANYVVQKVLETCNEQQRELILSRIKVHLNALKKYTYGKHIVARVEKLVTAGERRIIAVQSEHPA